MLHPVRLCVCPFVRPIPNILDRKYRRAPKVQDDKPLQQIVACCTVTYLERLLISLRVTRSVLETDKRTSTKATFHYASGAE